jgi:ABC-2 type transport system permease protein
MVRAEYEKWRVTIAASLARQMAYKFDFFFTLIAPGLVFVAINYGLWSSIYHFREMTPVAGFSAENMLQYQCWAFIANLLIRSHRTWNLSEDIRLGRITSFLLYPFDFWKTHAAEFLAFQAVQIVIASLALTVLVSAGFLPVPDMAQLLTGVALCLSVGALWFAIEFTIGIAAFWLEESWIMRYILHTFIVLFSGAFIPIELFPPLVREVLAYTPLPLLASLPIHVFMGTAATALSTTFVVLFVWTAIVIWIASRVWKKGIRYYSGAGM